MGDTVELLREKSSHEGGVDLTHGVVQICVFSGWAIVCGGYWSQAPSAQY